MTIDVIDPAVDGANNNSTPTRKELFPETSGIRPLPFSSPFINPTDVTADVQEEEPVDTTGLDQLSKKDSRIVNKYFSHLFGSVKSASRPSSDEDRRLSMKDGMTLETISLIPLEGVKILGGPTKVLQWMALLAALKLRRSQVSLWADLTYIMIGQEKIDLLKKPFSVDVETIKQIANKMWTDPHVMSRATNGKTEEFARRVFAKLLLSTLDSDFKQSILSRIGDSESILANDGPLLYVLIVRELFPQESLFFIELRTHASNLECAKFRDFQMFLNTLRDYAMMLPGAENQAALLPVLLRSINEQSTPLLRNHFHSVATDHYVFQKTSKSIEDYISDASRILSLSSNQLLSFAENQLPPAPPSHSKRPTSDAGDLLTLAANTDDLQALREQLISFAASTHGGQGTSDAKRSFNRYAHLPKPDWYKTAPTDPKEIRDFEKKKWRFCSKCGHWSTRHDTSTHKDFPPRSDGANKRPKTANKPSTRPVRAPQAKVAEHALISVLAKSLVGMIQK
jgi:hypothetical protein